MKTIVKHSTATATIHTPTDNATEITIEHDNSIYIITSFINILGSPPSGLFITALQLMDKRVKHNTIMLSTKPK